MGPSSLPAELERSLFNEAQRRARQQLAIDGAQLVRQRLDVRCRDREHRVRQASELDPLALGDELEVGGDGVERTRLGTGDRELALGVAAEHALTELARAGLVGQLDRVSAMRLHSDDGHALSRNDPRKTQARLKILELRHGNPADHRTRSSRPGEAHPGATGAVVVQVGCDHLSQSHVCELMCGSFIQSHCPCMTLWLISMFSSTFASARHAVPPTHEWLEVSRVSVQPPVRAHLIDHLLWPAHERLALAPIGADEVEIFGAEPAFAARPARGRPLRSVKPSVDESR